MSPDLYSFPRGQEFLQQIEEAAIYCSKTTDEFSLSAGEKLPTTIRNLGSTLSVLYRLSCCAHGCNGGDHQLEWLAGRMTNQACASIRLIRSAYYDEALMLIRGIGEIANLLQLFANDDSSFERWKSSTHRQRMQRFSPASVRAYLEEHDCKPLAIDSERYRRLCEVGTHPVPGLVPGHYTGSGRPALGGLLQHVGVYVCYTELGFAVSLCGTGFLQVLEMGKAQKQELLDASLALIRSLGSFTILNYEELLKKALR